VDTIDRRLGEDELVERAQTNHGCVRDAGSSWSAKERCPEMNGGREAASSSTETSFAGADGTTQDTTAGSILQRMFVNILETSSTCSQTPKSGTKGVVPSVRTCFWEGAVHRNSTSDMERTVELRPALG
jgi:hypothetical protein